MSKKQLVAEVLFQAAFVVFAIWLGGQVFNALMVVPVWSASLPESVIATSVPAQFSAHRTNFFALFNPLWVTLLMIASLLLGRGGTHARRRWMIAFTACAAVAALAVLGWMAPTVGRSMNAIREGHFSPEMADALRLWIKLNWARLGLELCGLLCALRALASPFALKARAESSEVEAAAALESSRPAAFGSA